MAENQAAKISFGRLVQNVGDTILPLTMSPAMQNIDISQSLEASRRPGYQRALTDTALGGTIKLAAKMTDKDGVEVYVVIGPDGVNRET